MAVADQITRLQALRTRIRTVLISWGIVTDSAAELDVLTAALELVDDNGAINGEIGEYDEVYPVPEGYHDGTGTVQITSVEQAKIIPDNIRVGVTLLGVPGNYAGAGAILQQKTVTPTKANQTVQPDVGYDGLSEVTVNAIPAAYQDVSATTAVSADVLAGKIYTTAVGTVTTGTMANNGAVAATFDGLTAATSSYTVPAGYHTGMGTVSLTSDIEDQLSGI